MTQQHTPQPFQQRLAAARSTHGLLHRIARHAEVSPSLVWRLAVGKSRDTRSAVAARIVAALDELAPVHPAAPPQPTATPISQ